MNWPTFFTRLGSAIVFCLIMMAGLLWNEWAFAGLILLIMVLCLRDYFRLTSKIINEEKGKGLDGTIGVFAVLTAVFFFLEYQHKPLALCNWGVSSVIPGWHDAIAKPDWPALVFIPILVLLIGFLSKKELVLKSLTTVGGIFYIVLPCIMLLYMRSMSLCIPLALILMIWMNDTMAYIVGSFIGKTPFSAISPKKTWEGTAGGAILTILGAAIFGYFTPYYRMIDWMMLALCASVAGTAGDLLESKLKRMAGVKDSGTMMPGHGGALDRFDSLLVATPFAFAWVYLFMSPLPLCVF